MRPSVSAIVPNYNHAKYIGKALRSVAEQLREGDELIVIDDASKDDSVAVATEIIRDIPGARLLRHATNQGALATLNEGLSLATKDYVCFPAADDIVVDGAIDKALRLLQAFPNAGFCSGYVRVIDENDRDLGPLPTRMVRERPAFLTPDEVRRELMFDDSWIVGLALYRTDLLRAAGGFLSQLSNFTDGFAGRYIAVRHGCCFAPSPFQLWRRMSAGLSWQETIDMKNVETIAERAGALMAHEADPNFPPGYSRRWQSRWRFGARAFAISLAQRRLWRHATSWSERRHPFFQIALSTLMAAARMPRLAVLFIRYRPFDLWPVVHRRIFRQHVG